MQFLGDLERFAATSLYPWRYVIAAVAAVAVIGLLVVAIRRGWLAAARRHPGRSVAAAVAVIVVLAPAAWYFGSPLIIRTELVEPAPAALVEPPAAVIASPAATDAPEARSAAPARVAVVRAGARAPHRLATPSTTPSPAPTPLVRTGEFAGADDFHFGRGKATLVEAPDGSHTLRFDDFSVRNGPDLFVYLSPKAKGYADGAIELGRLRATDGSFNTPIPAGTDLGDVKSVVIWCKEFAVLFAVARLRVLPPDARSCTSGAMPPARWAPMTGVTTVLHCGGMRARPRHAGRASGPEPEPVDPGRSRSGRHGVGMLTKVVKPVDS